MNQLNQIVDKLEITLKEFRQLTHIVMKHYACFTKYLFYLIFQPVIITIAWLFYDENHIAYQYKITKD